MVIWPPEFEFDISLFKCPPSDPNQHTSDLLVIFKPTNKKTLPEDYLFPRIRIWCHLSRQVTAVFYPLKFEFHIMIEDIRVVSWNGTQRNEVEPEPKLKKRRNAFRSWNFVKMWFFCYLWMTTLSNRRQTDSLLSVVGWKTVGQDIQKFSCKYLCTPLRLVELISQDCLNRSYYFVMGEIRKSWIV